MNEVGLNTAMRMRCFRERLGLLEEGGVALLFDVGLVRAFVSCVCLRGLGCRQYGIVLQQETFKNAVAVKSTYCAKKKTTIFACFFLM